MVQEDLENLKARLQRDIRQFAESGTIIVNRTMPFSDSTALRTAADQFRQAAKALDQLDGVQQALYFMKAK
jgi:hypothetical protein